MVRQIKTIFKALSLKYCLKSCVPEPNCGDMVIDRGYYFIWLIKNTEKFVLASLQDFSQLKLYSLSTSSL